MARQISTFQLLPFNFGCAVAIRLLLMAALLLPTSASVRADEEPNKAVDIAEMAAVVELQNDAAEPADTIVDADDLTEGGIVNEASPSDEPAPAEEAPAAEQDAPTKAIAPSETKHSSTETLAQDDSEPFELEPSLVDEAISQEKTNQVVTAASESEATGSESTPDVAVAYAEQKTVRRAMFRKVLPGEATRADLVEGWGAPAGVARTATGEVLLYQIDPFARVDVLIEDDIVEIIRIELAQQEQPDRLAKRLRADEVESIELIDPKTGELLGLSYPEKGMMLMLAEAPATPTTPQFVTHIVIGRLDADAFALRADNRPAEAYKQRLADVTRAIEVDSSCSFAHYLAAELYLATGQIEAAYESIQSAIDAEPENNAYRLVWTKVLLEQGQLDKAVRETRAVLDAEPDDSVVKASALYLMGRLASYGDASISDKAIAFHTQAISIADKLATQPDQKDRQAAKRLLVESHLAIAREIARRNYERKTEVVAQWIGRASGLAEEMIDNDNGPLELRLLVARDALAALSHLKPAKDPQPWIAEAQETADAIRSESEDPLMNARVDWLLGESYFHAMKIEHTRGEVENALANGEQAIEHLQAGAAVGDIRPSAEQLVGNLYFHLGAVHAVHNRDHEKAVEWYDQAYPLLTGETPESKLLVPRRRGEAFVSMAVSYWNQGEKEHAIKLTIDGSELMEKAVQARVLEEKALTVPYGNLATMHRKRGDDAQAARFDKLASNARRGFATASRPSTAGQAGGKDNAGQAERR